MKLHLLAIGAHPDDVELGCSGTIINHLKKGQTVGIVDLTEGELGSRGTVETRYAEAAAANQIMGLSARINLQLPDGFFSYNKENALKVVSAIRHFKPEIILANAVIDRHPDHGHGATLVRDAAFLSGLIKIKTTWEGVEQEPWRPKRIFHYIQDRFIEPDFVVDITESFEDKMKAVKCYGTQFFQQDADGEPKTYISGANFLQGIESRAFMFGKRIGVRYGEGFTSENVPGIQDLDSLIYPELV